MRNTRLITEMILLFGVLPLVVLWLNTQALLAILWLFALGILVALLRDRTFSRRGLWNAQAMSDHWKPVVVRFGILAPVILFATWRLTPELLFSFPRERPALFALILFGYPVVSVYPQGIIYRAFLLHRFRPLLRNPRVRVAIAALCFGFLHIIFKNPIAPVITLLGGVMFTWTHERSKSLFVSSFEHTLFGLWVMTTGWGAFLYPGTVEEALQSLPWN